MKQTFTRLLAAFGLLASTVVHAQNVGIGTTAPTQTLDVNGGLRVRGLTGTDKRLVQANPDGTLSTSSSLPAVTVLTTPPNLGSVPVTNPQGVAVSGNYLYVSKQGPNELRVFDISVPTTLTPVGTPVAGGSGLDLLIVNGSYIYVCDISADQLRVYTTTGAGTPTNPSLVTTIATANQPNGAAVVGNFLYIACYGPDAIQRFDISNPALPALAGTTAAGDGVAGLTTLNGYLYAANYNANTLQTFSVDATTGVLTSVNVQTVGTRPNAVATANGLLYLTNSGNNNLQTFSLSNPALPVSQGTVPTGGRPYGFAVKGNYAYISNTTSNTVEVRQLTLSNALGFDSSGNLASIPSSSLGDNLGNHTATTNLNLNGNFLVGGTLGTPGTTGIYVSPTGAVGINTLVPFSQLSNTNVNTIGSEGNGGNPGSLNWSANQAGYAAQIYNAGTGAASNGLAVKINGSNTGATALDVSKGTTQNAAGTALLTVKSSGNVGVGTNAPLGRLDVQGGADNGGNNDPGGLALSYRTGGYRHFIRSRHNGTITGAGNSIDFYLNNSTTAGGSTLAGTGNTQVLTLESNNSQPRMGIGTTTPGATLHVAGAASTVRLEGLTGTGTRVVTADANGNLSAAGTVTGESTTAGNGLTLSGTQVQLGGTLSANTSVALGSNTLSFTGTGNVGIGTAANATYKLTISGGNTRLATPGNEGNLYGVDQIVGLNDLRFYTDDAGALERIRVQGSGEVGIGTTTPAAKLDVNGTTKLGTNGTVLAAVIRATVTKDVGPIGTNGTITVTFAVPNAVPGASVYISPANDLPDGTNISYARVSANGTVTAKFSNSTNSTVDPGNMNYFITVIQ